MQKMCLLLAAGFLLVGGCKHPFPVAASGEFEVDGFLRTSNEVVLVNPAPESQPIVPIPLGDAGGCDPNSCLHPGTIRVAVIDVDGVLVNQITGGLTGESENPVGLFREKLAAVEADSLVRAVVLRINSIGGSVAATDMMHRELVKFRERTSAEVPVIACVMDYGTGGAYFLACAADSIVAHPSTIVGGIGVMLNLYNLNGVLGQFSIVPQPVKAGENIAMGSSQEALDEQSEQMLQSMANAYHDRFKNVVRQARPRLHDPLGSVFDGRVFAARDAVELGLIDQIAYLDDAVQMAANLAGSNTPGGVCEKAVPVLYRRCGQGAARSLYSTTHGNPGAAGLELLPEFPGLSDNKGPVFMYAWHPQLIVPAVGN